MARSRERGTGSVYLKEDPNSPGQKLQTWWISYYIDGKRKRESSKSRKKSDAQALLRRRMGEHALGLEIGDEEKRLTFEDLEALLGTALAYMGRKTDAIREGRLAVRLSPMSRNAYRAPYLQHQLVRIYLLVGEPERALDALEPLLRIPYFLSPGWLRVDPTFDPLWGSPRFQKLLQGTS